MAYTVGADGETSNCGAEFDWCPAEFKFDSEVIREASGGTWRDQSLGFLWWMISNLGVVPRC